MSRATQPKTGDGKMKKAEQRKVELFEALEVINLIHSAKTQEEAMKRLKALLGNNPKMNAGCWRAYKNLPKIAAGN